MAATQGATQKKQARSRSTSSKSRGLFNGNAQRQITSSLNTLNKYLPMIQKDRSVEQPEGFNDFGNQFRIMSKWIQKHLAHYGGQTATTAVNGARSGPRTKAAGGGGGPGAQSAA